MMSTCGWVDGWMDGWLAGWMDGWMGARSVAQRHRQRRAIKTGAYRPGRGEEWVLLGGLHSRPRVIVGIEAIVLIVEASRRGGVV